MSVQVNGSAGAVSWDSLLGKIGEVTKTQGADGVAGTTNVTITTTVDGVETPVTVRIPDDLDLPGAVDQAAIDSLCEKLSADTGLNLAEEQISQFHDALSGALTEVAGASVANPSASSIKGAMFDLYKLMALLVEVAQKQRDASREMRQSENQMIQQSILNQADAQRQAAMTGMIAGAICCTLQVAATGYSLYKQGKAFNAQLGTDKTAGLDVARQNVDMLKASNTQANADSQLAKVKADIGTKMSLDGHTRITAKVEGDFNNPQFNEASARLADAKHALQAKAELSGKMRQLSSEPYIDDVTSETLAPLEAQELAGVKTAVAKLDAYKAEMAKLDQYGLTADEKAFFADKSTQEFQTLSMADRARLMDLKMRHNGLSTADLNFGDKPLAQLKADVKTAFDDAIAQAEGQLAPAGQLKVGFESAKENFRAQTKLEMQKFEDAYDAELKNYNEVRESGTKAEIAAAEERLQTASDQLKYARALGNSKLMAPDVTDAKTHLADVEDARTKYAVAQQARANSVDYIKASNAINTAQAQNNLIAAIGSFAQNFVQNLSQLQQAEATKQGAQQKKAEEELDQTRDLFNQAEELVNNVVQLMNAVRQAETQSMRDAIQA
ncbi:MAG: hypothetical protein IJ658_07315 [Kiritimatiellae bacterium]|nr:hypothetical protein [Kiritimatiellia bacterium]